MFKIKDTVYFGYGNCMNENYCKSDFEKPGNSVNELIDFSGFLVGFFLRSFLYMVREQGMVK